MYIINDNDFSKNVINVESQTNYLKKTEFLNLLIYLGNITMKNW